MSSPHIAHRYGPWAVVTGASSGIGRAFVDRVAREGLDVVLVSRSQERLATIGRDVSQRHGVRHLVVPADLGSEEGPAQVIAACEGLDVGLLFSNAGDGRPRDFVDADIEALRRELLLNASSHLELAHHFAGPMVERGRGGLLFTSASGGRHGMPHFANGGAAKGYVHHLAEGLHHELRPSGVDVTALLPGNVDTPIVDRIGLDRASLPSLISADQAADEALRALLAGRASHIPGRLLRTTLPLVPRPLSVRLNGRLMLAAARRNAARDAGLVSPG